MTAFGSERPVTTLKERLIPEAMQERLRAEGCWRQVPPLVVCETADIEGYLSGRYSEIIIAAVVHHDARSNHAAVRTAVLSHRGTAGSSGPMQSCQRRRFWHAQASIGLAQYLVRAHAPSGRDWLPVTSLSKHRQLGFSKRSCAITRSAAPLFALASNGAKRKDRAHPPRTTTGSSAPVLRPRRRQTESSHQ